MRKSLLKVFGFVLGLSVCLSAVAGLAYASFVDKIKFDNAYVSVGSADLKLVNNLANPPHAENLVEEKTPPNLIQISPTWSKDYLVKLYSDASSTMQITTKAEYTTANDPDDIRRYLMVEIFDWDDTNLNGLAELSEVGTSYGKKNIIDWKSDGFRLKDMSVTDVKGYVLRFSAPNIPSEKQDKEARFSFEFNSLGL